MQVQCRHTTTAKPLLLLVGSGELLGLLSQRLLETWRLALIETGESKGTSYPAGVLVHHGTATDSRTLRKAGAEAASAIFVATSDDSLNLEVCRLAQGLFAIGSVYALVSDQEMTPEFEAAGIEILSRNASLAFAAESRLQPGTAIARGVGLGRGEIFQVEVLPGSTAIGKTPRMLNPQSWLIAAIYRGSVLIVPHGDTEICEGDKVLLVGQPEILPGVSNFFRAGTSEFPLQYGAKVVALAAKDLPLSTEAEAHYLASRTEATGAAFLLGKWDRESSLFEQNVEIVVEPEAFSSISKLGEVLDRLDSGCCVLPGPEPKWYYSLGFGARRTFQLLEAHNEPVLVARGSYPYSRVVLGVKPGKANRFASEMAVDLCRGLNAELLAVAVCPSPLISGEGYREELEEALDQVQKLGEIYSLDLQTRLEFGNPVQTMARYSREYDLLVLSHRTGRRQSWSNPDVSRHLILRSECSVLCLPHCL